MRAILSRLIPDLAVIWSFTCFYFFNNYYRSFLNVDAKNTILVLAIVLSAIVSVDAFFAAKSGRINFGLKLWLSLKQLFATIRTVIQQPSSAFKIGAGAKKTLLFTLVKFFFIPIMIKFAVGNSQSVIFKLERIYATPSFDLSMFWVNDIFYPLMLSLIFLVDTGVFAFGYLFESKWLNNRVRSVDGTFFGWAVALICYPPITGVFANWAPWHTNDYAWFGSGQSTMVIRILLLILISGYLWATLSLGTKASNLTNRGIVTTGVYRFVRHPAYICKNLFWWIVLIPAVQYQPLAILGMLFWSTVYFFRAITEERHLIKDPDYQAYCQEVKWRFVPGLI